MPVFTFDEPSHTYALDGQRLPSVTEILEPVKPDFSMVPRDVLEAKRAFGTAVHLACELDDLGELDDDATDPNVMGCVQAWRKFKEDTIASVVENERRLYHPMMRFAGTVDRVAFLRLHGDATSNPWVIDLKTGVDPHPSYGVQLSGYLMLLNAQKEGRMPDGSRRATVHLDSSGTYRFHQFPNPNDEAAFMACLSIHHWKESSK